MERGTVRPMTLQRRFLTMRDAAPAAAAEAPAAEAAPSRVRRFVASNERVDSYNTIIRADAWDLADFERNAVVLFGHQSRDLPIAKGKAFVEGGELLLDAEFFDAETNPRAEQVMRILDQGVMGASVGFDPLEWEYDQTRETGDEWQDAIFPPLNYTRVRLLEVSVVTLPANGDALPVGREQVRDRLLARLEAKRAPPPAPKPETTITSEQLRQLVDEVVSTEVRAFKARKRGTLSGV